MKIKRFNTFEKKEELKPLADDILIEWPERVKEALPKNRIFLKFLFIDNKKREIRHLGV